MKKQLSLDLNKLLSSYYQSPDLPYEIIESFLKTLPTFTRALSKSIVTKDPKSIELIAHTIRGALSSLYAEPARLLSWKLEQVARGQNTKTIETTAKELQLALDELKQDLMQILKNKANNNEQKKRTHRR